MRLNRLSLAAVFLLVAAITVIVFRPVHLTRCSERPIHDETTAATQV